MPCPYAVFLLGLTAAAVAAAAPAAELVRNPGFAAPPGDRLPNDWTAWQPNWEGARCTLEATPEWLRVAAPRRPFAVGGVQQTLSDMVGGQAYAFEAECDLHRITFPYQALSLRVDWLAGGQPVHPAGDLVRGPFLPGGSRGSREIGRA